MKVKLLTSVQLFGTLWTVAYHTPPSMGFSRQNTGVGCYFLLQRIFPTQGSNPGHLLCRQTLYRLSHQGSHIQTLLENSNGEGNGTPLQYSCLENPMYGRAW